jgi:DNA repair exonuclease SbcCD ATPase subunit
MALVHSGVIENYIQRVTELSQSTQRIPTTAELEAIARELGIEPEEIQAAQKQATDHFTRAQGYMRLGYWDDAIAELDDAIAFNPGESKFLLSSAEAYLGKWKEHHRSPDADQMHLRVRQCLSLEPGCEGALDLLAEFRRRQKRHLRTIMGGLMFVGAVICGGGIYLLFHGGLPFVIEEKARLETLQGTIEAQNNTIAQLMGEQEALRREFHTIISQQLQENRLNGDRLENLQARLKELEEKIKEYQTPPILTPTPTPSPTPPQPQGNDE